MADHSAGAFPDMVGGLDSKELLMSSAVSKLECRRRQC